MTGKKRISCLLVCCMALSYAPISVSAQSEDTITLTPVADTYVECRSNTAQNHGDDEKMFVNRVGNPGYALLKFELPQLPEGKGIKEAHLKLTARNELPNVTGKSYYAAKLSSDEWEENSVTGDSIYHSRYMPDGTYTFPADGTVKIFTELEHDIAKNEAFEMDVTSAIVYDYLYKHSDTSIVIGTDEDKGTDNENLKSMAIWTKEATSEQNKPELVITLGDEIYSELTSEIECTASVNNDKSNPDANQTPGNGIILTKDRREGYMKFDCADALAKVPEGFAVSEVKLQTVLDTNAKTGLSDGMLKAFGTDDDWTAEDLTWNNSPVAEKSFSECKLSDFGGSRKYATFDITDFAQKKIYADKEQMISVKLTSEYHTYVEGENDNITIDSPTVTDETRRPGLLMKFTNNPDEVKVIKDAASITLPDTVFSNEQLVLSETGENGSAISWSSSDPNVISDDGTVSPGNGDKTVKLTAEITSGNASKTRTFDVTVKEYVISIVNQPAHKSYLIGSEIPFEGYAQDFEECGIDRIEFLIDGEPKKTVNEESYSFALNDIEAGEHELTVKAFNKNGKYGVSETVKFTVAGYSFANMYRDGMVLQRSKPVKIAGTGIDGTIVKAAIQNKSASSVVSNGRFEITLPALSASREDILSIEADGIKTEFKVGVGEVILLNGQSNMAYSLSHFSELKEKYNEDVDEVHLFKQDITKSADEQTDIPSGIWTSGNISEAQDFSGFGFGVGVDLYKALGGEVPVGLIFAAEGGTSINRWVKNGSFANDPDLAAMSAEETNYNTMVAPFKNYTIGHVLFYQGEANTKTTQNYEKALTRYIDCLREDFNDESIDFTIIQLPIFDYQAEYGSADRTAVGVRQAQWNVSERVENTACVVAIDTGLAQNIHPNDKLTIIPRAANAIRHFINPDDDTIKYKSASYVSCSEEGDKLIITFKDTEGSLKTKDGKPPVGFKLAGDDNEFQDVSAEIVNDTIEVDTSSVTGTPKLRYAWEDCPALNDDGKTTGLNVVNGAGLPVAPFRTDNEPYCDENGEPVNFTPMIRNIKAGTIENNSAVITVCARDYDDEIADVEVFADGESIGKANRVQDSACDYEITWNDATEGVHNIHAIATDSKGASSVRRDLSLGESSVEPQIYAIPFEGKAEEKPLLYLTDLNGGNIEDFDGSGDITANTTLIGELLIIAAYTDGVLTKCNISNGTNVSLTAEELAGADTVKAFLFDSETELLPLSDAKVLFKR